MMKKLLGVSLFILVTMGLWAQNVVLRGKVVDKTTGEPLIAANVVVKGTTTGTVTDFNGAFQLEVAWRDDLVLVISYVGYLSKEVKVSSPEEELSIQLEQAVIPGQEVVVTASRVEETIMEAPVSIEKITAREIQSAASGDFYESLGYLKGVDIVTSSMGFKTVNTRGFATTSPFRQVQFIDGMDNQAPGLNFPVGNLVGAPEIDLQSVELISGAASALYGANAFQGIISMTSKNPYDYPGIAIMLKGGNRQYVEGQFRYAQAYGKSKKFALKLTGGYMQAEDWPATDPEANTYGDIETEVNLSEIVRQKQFDESLTEEERDDFIALNNYLDFYPIAIPGDKEGKKGWIDIKAPGYPETALADYTTKSLKLQGSAYYRFNDSLELSYLYKFGNGTAIYQGTNRYSINDILFQQHKVELNGKRFFVKYYTTKEDAGDSYDMVFTAINISKFGFKEYVGEYLSVYFDWLDSLTNGFDDEAKQWMVDLANQAARDSAADEFPQPGTYRFDSLFNEITSNPDLKKGSKFVDESSYHHFESQYNFNWKPLDIIAGAAFRYWNPQSFGTIFSDTLKNPADTLDDGRPKPNAEYVDLHTWEVGGYVQASKTLLKNNPDHSVKLTGSIRVDKHQNFDVQFSPRISGVYSFRNHYFRIAAQSAFRTPTLQNQYIHLDLGPIKLIGNLSGYDNFYTLESVDSFLAHYDSTYEIDPSLLEYVKVDPIQPEQVKSIEIGYRTAIDNRWYIDVNGYYSRYSNFIGDLRVAKPKGAARAGEESGEDAIITGQYELYQLPVNAKEKVTTYGATAGISYYIGRGITTSANYTYSGINTKNLDDPILPGFNTPEHKINLGLSGRKVYKGLGFNFNFKWVSDYFWESTFGDGPVEGYHYLDGQVYYEFPEWYSTIRIGASNIYNRKYKTAYGSPEIGRFVYASYTFEFRDLDRWRRNP